MTGATESEDQLLTVAFLRKYVHYAKAKFGKQLLTQEAFEEISNFYVEVRHAAASGTVDPRFRYGENIIASNFVGNTSEYTT